MVCEVCVCGWGSGCTAAVLLSTAFRICLKQHATFPSSFFSRCFSRVQEVQPYSSTDTAPACKNSCFILSEGSDFHAVINLSIAVHTLPVSKTQRISGELRISQSEVVCHFNDHGKSIQSCWIVPNIIKILPNLTNSSNLYPI